MKLFKNDDIYSIRNMNFTLFKTLRGRFLLFSHLPGVALVPLLPRAIDI